MTSSIAPLRKRKNWPLRIGIIVLVLFALYSAAWFYASSQMQRRIDLTLAQMNGRGVIAQCVNRHVGGYPFYLRLRCGSLNYENGGKGIFARTGGFVSSIGGTSPLTARTEVQGPLSLTLDNVPPLAINWAALHTDLKLGAPTPRQIELVGSEIKGQTKPSNNEAPVPLFQLAALNAVLQPVGQDLDYSGKVDDLQIDPAAVDGRAIAPLDASADLRIVNGAGLLKSRARSFRGQQADIRSLTLNVGTGSVSLSGPVSIGTDGLINADVQVKIQDPQALGQAVKQAAPEMAKDIDRAMIGVALMGKSINLPLKVTAGRAALGPFPLGMLPPLD